MKRLLIAGFGDTVSISTAPRRSARSRPTSSFTAPPAQGDTDARTAKLLAALETGRILPARIVYVSTSGVYGDCAGAPGIYAKG